MPAGAKFATFIVVGALNCIYKMWGSMSSDNQSANQCVYFRKKKTLGLYALRVLRAYGMSHAALQAIFRSVAISKLLYASSAWIGFTKATDRQRVDGFLRCNIRSGYCSPDTPTFAEQCANVDEQYYLTTFVTTRITYCTVSFLHLQQPHKTTIFDPELTANTTTATYWTSD